MASGLVPNTSITFIFPPVRVLFSKTSITSFKIHYNKADYLRSSWKISQSMYLPPIFIKPVNVPESVNILKRATGLDLGESEAIVLTDELKECITGLQHAGRHIGQRHYQMLLNRLKD